ncbi:M24 family metallopeptidase [Acidisoma sp.]|uniref:M24 family metallopeptidase n=1 Tax=Acidisoma sp. TaxID=1872115 RepID=UPI003B006E75
MDVAGATSDRAVNRRNLPFDADHLDRLMDEAGLDVLVLTSKHNVQYLLGGYRFFFFDGMDAIGVSRYLPVIVYAKGRLDDSGYIGNAMESYERDLGKFWMPSVQTKSWSSQTSAQLAADHIRQLGLAGKRIGVEMAFLPADAYLALQAALPDATFDDALVPLERLRAIKTPKELTLLREASEKVVEAMMVVISTHGPGDTKRQMVEALKREEVARGMTFEYCLITAGASHNRAPSDQALREGDVLSVDSGGNYKGYIGDVCRMGILGEPDTELVDLLGEIDAIQMAARKPIKAGARGGDIFDPALALLERSKISSFTHFTAHGMGIISHEAPRLTSTGFVPYPGYDEDRPLQTGMVISIETTMLHPSRGYIKLEDTVAVTDSGWVGFGDGGRGWNRGRSPR